MTYEKFCIISTMGAAGSVQLEQFPGLKEAYEEKSKEEGITDDALFEYMKGLVEAAQSTLSEVAPVEGEEPAADPAAEEAVAPEPEAAVEAAAE